MKKSIFATVFLLIAAVAGADTLNLTGPYSFAYNGYVVGPIQGNLNGVTPLTVICNDYADTSYLGSSWGVNISTIPTLEFAMYAQTGPPTAGQLANYEMASMLLWQMNQPGNQNGDAIGGLNFAIWNLFNPAVPDPGTSAYWVSWAQAQDRSAWDYSNVRVYTDVDTVDPHNQEFLGGSAVPVPEPGTGILFGLGGMGLLLCGAIRPRRK